MLRNFNFQMKSYILQRIPAQIKARGSPGPIRISSMQFGKSTSEASSEHSFAEQCEVPASCIDSVDYIDVDTEAGAEVERWDEQRPVLDDSVGRRNNNTAIPTANGTSSCGHGGAARRTRTQRHRYGHPRQAGSGARAAAGWWPTGARMTNSR